MLDDLKSLVATVEAFRSVEGALDLAEMLRQKMLPNVTPAAYVAPAGMNALDKGEAGAGSFLQMAEHVFAVIIVMRTAGDVTGSKTQPGLDAIVDATINAVIGDGPSAASGVFALRRGRLSALNAGTAIYQLDFSIKDQLRKLA